MQHVAVYCGSSRGKRAEYADAARTLGQLLAERGWGLVYGGGQIGLMGVVADAVLEAGGQVTGVIPQALATQELAHARLTELVITESMHTRKAIMAERADAFIALPGGYGTFDELCEILTWGQLSYHRKPVGLLNVAGFYDGLLSFLDHMVTEGFVRLAHRDMLLVDAQPDQLLDRLLTYQPQTVTKWHDR